MEEDICKECGCSLRVTGSKNEIVGDESDKTQTRLFCVLTLECVNKKCAAFGAKKEIRNEQPVG